MATNLFFNNFASSQEQKLIEDLVIESIKIYGLDVFYIPRRIIDKDTLYGESPAAEFTTSYFVEMYIKNVDGFGGDGDFMSKFNIEIRDEITFTIARRVFDEEVGYPEQVVRPREGDLIYFPLNKKIFQIKFVEHEPVFYQLGALQMYDLKCELFEYSSERMNTGFEELDALEINYSLASATFAYLTENDFQIVDEEGNDYTLESFDVEQQDLSSDNVIVQTESDAFLDFTEADPFSEGGRF